MNTTAKGKEFEEYVAHIYELLLKLENEHTLLSRDIKLVKNGVEHQIDIYYEFTKANVPHRVAIECKNRETPVHQKELAAFESGIGHLKDITGVVISKSGYTEGAIHYAEEMGIKLINYDELPHFINLIGLNLHKAFIPIQMHQANHSIQCLKLIQMENGMVITWWTIIRTENSLTFSYPKSMANSL
jgi:hypothetical protein